MSRPLHVTPTAAIESLSADHRLVSSEGKSEIHEGGPTATVTEEQQQQGAEGATAVPSSDGNETAVAKQDKAGPGD